jgi:hypothetical protein
MKTFKTRTQTHLTHAISKGKVSQWAEITTDDIRLTIDGRSTDNTLLIHFEANGVRYIFTDVLLEVMLGYVAENYENEYLNFRVQDLPRKKNG